MNRLKEIRLEAGMTRRELADALNTSEGQIYQLEKGIRKLDETWMRRIAPIFKCAPGELISPLPKNDIDDDLIKQAGIAIDSVTSAKSLGRAEFLAATIALAKHVQKYRAQGEEVPVSAAIAEPFLDRFVHKKE